MQQPLVFFVFYNKLPEKVLTKLNTADIIIQKVEVRYVISNPYAKEVTIPLYGQKGHGAEGSIVKAHLGVCNKMYMTVAAAECY